MVGGDAMTGSDYGVEALAVLFLLLAGEGEWRIGRRWVAWVCWTWAGFIALVTAAFAIVGAMHR